MKRIVCYGDSKSPVQLFATCLVEVVRPEAGLAVVKVLERLGVHRPKSLHVVLIA